MIYIMTFINIYIIIIIIIRRAPYQCVAPLATNSHYIIEVYSVFNYARAGFYSASA